MRIAQLIRGDATIRAMAIVLGVLVATGYVVSIAAFFLAMDASLADVAIVSILVLPLAFLAFGLYLLAGVAIVLSFRRRRDD